MILPIQEVFRSSSLWRATVLPSAHSPSSLAVWVMILAIRECSSLAWLSTRSGQSSMVSFIQQHVLFVFSRILQGMDGSIHDISKYHRNAQPIILTGPEEEYRVCDLWSCCIFGFHLSFATGGLFAFGSWH